MNKVFIISSNKSLIENIKEMHIAIVGYKIIGVTDKLSFTISILDEINPDIILIDSNKPYFTSAMVVREIKNLTKDYKVIVLTDGNNHESLYYSWAYGANSIFSKEVKSEELIRVYETVNMGLKVFKTVNSYFSFNANKRRLSVKPILSLHEIRILNYLSKGYKRKEVENIIGGEGGKIDYQCKKIFDKFNKNNLADVIKQAKIEHIL